MPSPVKAHSADSFFSGFDHANPISGDSLPTAQDMEFISSDDEFDIDNMSDIEPSLAPEAEEVSEMNAAMENIALVSQERNEMMYGQAFPQHQLHGQSFPQQQGQGFPQQGQGFPQRQQQQQHAQSFPQQQLRHQQHSFGNASTVETSRRGLSQKVIARKINSCETKKRNLAVDVNDRYKTLTASLKNMKDTYVGHDYVTSLEDMMTTINTYLKSFSISKLNIPEYLSLQDAVSKEVDDQIKRQKLALKNLKAFKTQNGLMNPKLQEYQEKEEEQNHLRLQHVQMDPINDTQTFDLFGDGSDGNQGTPSTETPMEVDVPRTSANSLY